MPCGSWEWARINLIKSQPVLLARYWENTILTGTRLFMTPWCVWPRISPSAIRWLTVRAISAPWTVMGLLPCAIRRRGFHPSLWRCCATLTRRQWISGLISTRRWKNLLFYLRVFPTCWLTVLQVLPLAWPPICPLTISPKR